MSISRGGDMVEFGYTLSAEEHGPADLVRWARAAEDAGFGFALISDHFHPWIDRQGHSPFVWTVLGGIAEATERLHVGTGVTCPLIRIHPAIVAQAAATTAALMSGRFFLGVGTGENLNEHILGDRWPPAAMRLEMLEEAVELIRFLWRGEDAPHRGRHYTVENARIYTLPEEPPPIFVAAAGEKATKLAGRIGDGLIGTSPDAEQIRRFERAGGEDKPRYAQVHVCWAGTEEEAKHVAREWWPNTTLPGELGVELALPRHFEQAAELLSEDDVCKQLTCGPDPETHRSTFR